MVQWPGRVQESSIKKKLNDGARKMESVTWFELEFLTYSRIDFLSETASFDVT